MWLYIHNQFWNNGYAYESMLKVLEIANKELEFHRLEAHVNLDNKPSFKLLEKLDLNLNVPEKVLYMSLGNGLIIIYYINLHDEDL